MSANLQTALSQACATMGVVFRNVPTDGRWHLADLVNDARGKGDGRIRLFPDGQGGIVANHKGRGTKAFFVDSKRSLSASEQFERQRLAAEIRTASDRDQAIRWAGASDEASRIFDVEKPCPSDHPYLIRKGVAAHPGFARMDAPDPWGRVGSIIVPMRLSPHGFIQSLQFITGDGDKRFLYGGRKKGCFFELHQNNSATPLFICEGLATGLTIHQATRKTVFVAFDAGNLEPAARNLRHWFPTHEFVIAADNDCQTIGNPGLSYAKRAAAAIGASVMLPPCDDGKARDWNDYAAEFGL